MATSSWWGPSRPSILLVYVPLWAAVLAVMTLGAILAMLIDLGLPAPAVAQVNGFITSWVSPS